MTKPETLPGAIKGASAVVFASSASRKGGNAEAVDYKGVENIARCVVFGVFVGIGVVGEVMVMDCVYVALPSFHSFKYKHYLPHPTAPASTRRSRGSWSSPAVPSAARTRSGTRWVDDKITALPCLACLRPDGHTAALAGRSDHIHVDPITNHRPTKQVTNIFGGIMGYKFLGEEALRKLYRSSAPKVCICVYVYMYMYMYMYACMYVQG